MASPKKKKAIDWDIFTKADLIKIGERYKEITKEKKRKKKREDKKREDKKL